MSTRLLLLALPPIAVLLIASLLVQLMVERDRETVDQKAAERLTLYRQTILGEYEKYRYLPYMLARDPRATVVLNMGRPTESANRFLEEVAEKSGADLLFVMDRQGRTLAASNWRDELSLVGQSYAYRPYFHAALKGKEGQFFAIGATLGEPGLFLSLPSPVSGEPNGVAVVKVDMEPLEQAWAKGGETVFASDANGVIFLASVADWRYRTLQELSVDVRSQITATRQYADQPLAALSQNPLGTEKVVTVDGRTYRHNSAQVGLLGWTLHFLVPIEETRKNIWPIWASAIGLSLLYFVGLLIQRGRVLRRASALLRQESQGLRELNQRLVDEVDERRRVEEELRNAQRHLARSSRLAAVGQMSAAVAHELNQPLAALRMFVAGARKFLESGNVPAVEDNLKEIDSLQHRMATLTQELKRFARPAESRIELVDLKNCIAAAEKIARSRFEEDGVNLDLRLPDGPLNLETAPLKVEQVLVNLLRNGADSAAKVEDGEVILEVDRQGESIVVSVSDNGAGVPADLREKIFDPFFTTKLSNGGLGLGLSISDRIAEDLGGSLQLKPNAAGGATFLFTLPAPEGAVRATTLEAEGAVLEPEAE
ncbi:sensor histidine kinase [Roseibium polysiphoniae]|uniref:C4-dicarboxylate transport sensor protein DctB n=1 Tax=Roseibium polysiphoniae TaxID=2571221 RepID=A0A944CF17_9HYPH|nr:ATP-binding protein [Roseibium polysiphoniae]MBS8261469.1 sensor histidine kinase [Roseibium polysiphoniae]